MTKNLTLSIDDDLLDKARVLAAMRRTSVNAMVRSYLEREIVSEARQASRAEAWGELFTAADNNAPKRKRRLSEDGQLFDREVFYEEVMRERGLL